jgi:chromosome segregation ATPase
MGQPRVAAATSAGSILGRGEEVVRGAEEFRKHAEECRCLSKRLTNPEHRSFALELASAWTELAEQAERIQAASKQSNSVAADSKAIPQPEDRPQESY